MSDKVMKKFIDPNIEKNYKLMASYIKENYEDITGVGLEITVS